MAVITLDGVDGSTGSLHVINGWTFTRLATISELGFPPGTTTSSQFDFALVALKSVTGDLGSPCPGFTETTYLEQFIPEAISPDIIKIRIVYKGFPATQIEIDTDLNQVESNLDADDNVISVEYDYPDDYNLDPRKAGTTITQGGFISKSIPEMTLTWRYTVAAAGSVTAGEQVTDLAIALVGAVNDDVWALAPGAPRTWLCTRVSGRSRDGGLTFEVSITFQYRQGTWDFLVVFVNPDDGKPPTDLIDGVGSKQVQGYDTATFPTHIP